MVETTVTYAMSSTTEMHAIGSKANAENGSVINRNSAMTGTVIIMPPTMTSLTNSILLKEGTFQEMSRPIPKT
jgi:hypothetical protein